MDNNNNLNDKKLIDLFDKAVHYVNNSNNKVDIDNNTKLNFYKFYKQATVGDINVDKPGLLDIKNSMKWDAWFSVKNTSKKKSMLCYIKLLENIESNWNKAL